MANRRLLSKSISTSLKVHALDEFAQLLFTWMIPHTDDFGRMDGEPEVVKALVMPLSKRKPSEFTRALEQMAELGLIYWYKSNEKVVAQIAQADQHQSNLISKRTISKFPPFDEASELIKGIPGISQNSRSNLTKPNLTKLKITQPNPTSESDLESVHSESFEKFWEAYPKKISKGQARRTWLKLNPNESLQGQILAALERAKTSESWAKESGRYIPHPATWLNAEGWEDKIPEGGSYVTQPDKYAHLYETGDTDAY